MKERCGDCKYYAILISDYALAIGNFGCCQIPVEIKQTRKLLDLYDIVEENEVCDFFKKGKFDKYL